MGGATYCGASHLDFIKLPLEKGRKLCKIEVWNRKFDSKIGIIHWRGGWRQYVFQADPEIDMSRSCQKEIISFINGLMEGWRNSHTKQEANNG